MISSRASLAPSIPASRLGLVTAWTGLLAAGCAVGPSYHRPAAPVPVAYKEAPGWKAATPRDDAGRAPWWEAFQDPMLNGFETEVATSNQSLRQAAANYEVARQIARADRATLLPSVSAEGSAVRSKAGNGRASAAAGGLTVVSASSSAPQNTFAASLAASWEPDFWGRIRRQTEADVNAAQSDAAALASARLSTQAALAGDYVALRVLDDKARLRQEAVAAYRRTLTIAENRYAVGVAAKSEVISARALLDGAQTQALDLGIQRAQFEHAIAVLLGKAPAEFSIPIRPEIGLTLPEIPAQVPSDLLERRPDIASAERSAMAANARVGVQTAAYFPSITLSGNAGYEGSPLSTLFSAPNRFWTLGANLSETLLDFGQRRAVVLQARAAYDGAVANYRGTILAALQQVEDALAGLRIYADEAKIQAAAVGEATEAARITLNEYHAGTVDYTTVVNAEVTEYGDRETALAITQSRFQASIALITALGGGWTSADLPAYGQVVARNPKQAP